MSTVNYADLYKQAIEDAQSGSFVVDDGPYLVQIAAKKPGLSKDGKKPQVGIRLKFMDGVYAGKSVWVNQTFTADSPSAVAVFIKRMRELGVPGEAIAAGEPPERLFGYIVEGTVGTANLGHHTFGVDKETGSPVKHQDLVSFSISEGAQPAQPSSAGAGPVFAPVAPQVAPQVQTQTAPAFVNPFAPTNGAGFTPGGQQF